jgi:hypothetical protein
MIRESTGKAFRPQGASITQETCIFCDIIAGKAPAHIVYEEELMAETAEIIGMD